jgi:hypothetical protein
MKEIIVLLFLTATLGAQTQDGKPPIIHTQKVTKTYEEEGCPDGYEEHFIGLDDMRTAGSGVIFYESSRQSPQGLVCITKEFADSLRSEYGKTGTRR